MEMAREFVGCLKCREALPKSWMNEMPEFDGEKTIEKRDMIDFLFKHRDHNLVKLLAIDTFPVDWDDPISGRHFSASWEDPMGKCYLEAMAETGQKFILERKRDSIFDSRSYTLSRGRIKVKVTDIFLKDEDLIRKESLAEKVELSDEKLHALIDSIRETFEMQKDSILSNVRERFQALQKEGLILATDRPNVFSLNDHNFIRSIKSAIRHICNEQERLSVEQFVDVNTKEEGVLLPEVTVDFIPIINVNPRKRPQQPHLETIHP